MSSVSPAISDSSLAKPSIHGGFDPVLHLDPLYKTPAALRMGELGYDRTADSDIAATKPFPLFTAEAVRRIREEMINHDTLANHIYSDTLNPSTIRGACPQRAPFTYSAWKHHAVVERIDDAAEIALTHVFDYEIGHTNLQLGPGGWAGLKADPDVAHSNESLATDTEISPTLMLAPNWHRDSYPFVCILMLSESSNLQGGRTVLRKADGSNLFCDLPPLGHAMILQGGHIEHAVSPTDKTQERMTMVTSFRPADPLSKDVCVLSTVRTQSDVPTLHRQWCQYRMHILAQRAEAMAAKLDDPNVADEIEKEMLKFVVEQGEFLAQTLGEMVKPVSHIRTNTRESFLRWKATYDIPQSRM